MKKGLPIRIPTLAVSIIAMFMFSIIIVPFAAHTCLTVADCAAADIEKRIATNPAKPSSKSVSGTIRIACNVEDCAAPDIKKRIETNPAKSSPKSHLGTVRVAACIAEDCYYSPDIKKHLGMTAKNSPPKLTSVASKQSSGSSAFGFIGQASKEKMSFGLGAFIADMQVIALSGGQGEMRLAAGSFVKVLSDLGAPPSLISRAEALRDKATKAADPIAEFNRGFPSLAGDIDAFIKNKMDGSYAVLGMWTEMARIFLNIDDNAIAADFIRENDAASLLDDLKAVNLPSQITSALTTLGSLKGKVEINARDIAAAQKAVDRIFAFMG